MRKKREIDGKEAAIVDKWWQSPTHLFLEQYLCLFLTKSTKNHVWYSALD
jgi:hypothetical protein